MYPQALKRKLAKDMDLQYPDDYAFHGLSELSYSPFNRDSGSHKTYSYTCFHRRYYRVQLTQRGLLKLLQAEEVRGDTLTRFTLSDLQFGSNQKDHTSSIEGFLSRPEEWITLSQQLSQLPNAFHHDYVINEFQQALTLPQNSDTPLYMGKTGWEKELESLSLSDMDCQLLWALAAHARGFEFESQPETIKLLTYGWLQIKDTELARHLKRLAAQLHSIHYPILLWEEID